MTGREPPGDLRTRAPVAAPRLSSVPLRPGPMMHALRYRTIAVSRRTTTRCPATAARPGDSGQNGGNTMQQQNFWLLIADHDSLLRTAVVELLQATEGIDIMPKAAEADAPPDDHGGVQPGRPHAEPADADASDLVSAILTRAPNTVVIMLDAHGDERLPDRAMAADGSDITQLRRAWDELLLRIRAIGRRTRRQSTLQDSPLSPRELEVLQLAARAMSNRQIASRLHIQDTTVKRHLRNIFRKLDAVSRIDAVSRAVTAALIDAPWQTEPGPPSTPSAPAADEQAADVPVQAGRDHQPNWHPARPPACEQSGQAGDTGHVTTSHPGNCFI
ncbi:MAG: response regulator transcription factor [Kibdelosporangium sp.]